MDQCSIQVKGLMLDFCKQQEMQDLFIWSQLKGKKIMQFVIE